MQADHLVNESSASTPGHKIAIQDASAWVLRIGVVTSVIVMVVGTTVSFFQHSLTVQYMEHTKVIDSARDLWQGLCNFRGQAIIELGIYLLVFTPIMRVVASMVLFCVEEHDWLYTTVTFFVLVLTLVGLLLLK
ncbi:MAG TPA: DUF1634 domain-containing protein [Tepidisphaeraceae bacterium]|jgi:uncharacterized membrane protein